MSDEVKKLYRSEDDRWIAGVCGGIGEYFNIDPTLVRVLFILFALAVGGGILIYIILWIVMPAHPDSLAFAEKEPAAEAGDVSEEGSEQTAE